MILDTPWKKKETAASTRLPAKGGKKEKKDDVFFFHTLGKGTAREGKSALGRQVRGGEKRKFPSPALAPEPKDGAMLFFRREWVKKGSSLYNLDLRTLAKRRTTARPLFRVWGDKKGVKNNKRTTTFYSGPEKGKKKR